MPKKKEKMNRLFRHITWLALTGIILTVAGCAYDDTVRDLREQPADSQGLAISFNNGIIDNPILRTRAVTLLSDHMASMGVWGWQTTPEGATERLFINQNVTFSAPQAKWTYSPVKYWEPKSTYWFCAYAPHSGDVPGVTVSIDSATHAFSIVGVTLQGCNTIDSGVPAPPANFSKVEDTDWMIDRTGQSMAGIYRNEVTFSMQHILSKLCIRVRRSYAIMHDTLMSLTVDSIKIGNFVSQGNFTQYMADDPVELAYEWTRIDTLPRYTVTSAKYASIPDSAAYILETLLIPQRLDDNQYLQIWYNIGDKNHFNNRISLNSLFNGFETGYNYVITITAGPEPIKFDAGIQDWNNDTAHEMIMKK